jgi:hypothetical protein
MQRATRRYLQSGWLVAATAIVLSVLCLPALSQAATVAGTVRDAENGQPLAFVTVQVIGETVKGGRINRGTMCGQDGAYALSGIPDGRYILRCSRIGYETFEDSLAVTAGREYRRDVSLAVQPVEVGEIVVTAVV